MKRFLIALALAGVCASAYAQTARDGNWWRTQPREYQLGYTLGLIDGTTDLWLRIDKYVVFAARHGEPLKFGDGALAEYLRASSAVPFMENVTAGQLADGMTQFYEDASNRLIPAPGAAWIVLRRIAGHPTADVDMAIQQMRAAAHDATQR